MDPKQHCNNNNNSSTHSSGRETPRHETDDRRDILYHAEPRGTGEAREKDGRETRLIKWKRFTVSDGTPTQTKTTQKRKAKEQCCYSAVTVTLPFYCIIGCQWPTNREIVYNANAIQFCCQWTHNPTDYRNPYPSNEINNERWTTAKKEPVCAVRVIISDKIKKKNHTHNCKIKQTMSEWNRWDMESCLYCFYISFCSFEVTKV